MKGIILLLIVAIAILILYKCNTSESFKENDLNTRILKIKVINKKASKDLGTFFVTKAHFEKAGKLDINGNSVSGKRHLVKIVHDNNGGKTMIFRRNLKIIGPYPYDQNFPDGFKIIVRPQSITLFPFEHQNTPNKRFVDETN